MKPPPRGIKCKTYSFEHSIYPVAFRRLASMCTRRQSVVGRCPCPTEPLPSCPYLHKILRVDENKLQKDQQTAPPPARLPKCLSLSSHELPDVESRFFRMAITTMSSTPMPRVNRVPVNRAANGRIEMPPAPSVRKSLKHCDLVHSNVCDRAFKKYTFIGLRLEKFTYMDLCDVE